MSRILTSIFGRRLGLDKDNYLTQGEYGLGIKMPSIYHGPTGSEVAQFGSTAVQVLTSGTTATQITAAGLTQINSSNALTWIMAPPTVSALKTISVQSTAASGAITVRLSTSLGGNFVTTAGSSFQAFTLLAAGQAATFIGVSTAYWQVLNNTSSAASGGMTT